MFNILQLLPHTSKSMDERNSNTIFFTITHTHVRWFEGKKQKLPIKEIDMH